MKVKVLTFKSRTKEGVFYRARQERTGQLSCTCPSYQFRSQCRHALRLRQLTDNAAEQAKPCSHEDGEEQVDCLEFNCHPRAIMNLGESCGCVRCMDYGEEVYLMIHDL